MLRRCGSALRIACRQPAQRGAERQAQHEARTVRGDVFDVYVAAVRTGDRLHDRKAEAGAIAAGGEKWFEYPVLQTWRYALTVVSDAQFCGVASDT
jgi:hypothetical protein